MSMPLGSRVIYLLVRPLPRLLAGTISAPYLISSDWYEQKLGILKATETIKVYKHFNVNVYLCPLSLVPTQSWFATHHLSLRYFNWTCPSTTTQLLSKPSAHDSLEHHHFWLRTLWTSTDHHQTLFSSRVASDKRQVPRALRVCLFKSNSIARCPHLRWVRSSSHLSLILCLVKLNTMGPPSWLFSGHLQPIPTESSSQFILFSPFQTVSHLSFLARSCGPLSYPHLVLHSRLLPHCSTSSRLCFSVSSTHETLLYLTPTVCRFG